MENNHIKEVELWAYLSKTADKEIIDKVDLWRNSIDYDDNLFNSIKTVYNATSENIENSTSIDGAKDKFFNTIEIDKPKSKNWRNIFKYAAIITFLIATSVYIYQESYNSNKRILVRTTFGEQKQINLPDGSIVSLNSSSNLSYNIDSPRTLFLEGEAFFEVAKDINNPFTVSTHDNVQVKALGTSFNVKSYKENSYMETVLLTGVIEMTSGKEQKQKILMKPNDKVTYFKDSEKIIKSKIDYTKTTIAWRDGKIQFKNKPFKEIAIDLAIQFNIQIHFENEPISNSRFTGSFDKSTPIDDILKTLKLSKDFEYKKSGGNQWLIK